MGVNSLSSGEDTQKILSALWYWPFIFGGLIFGYEVAQGRLSLKTITIGIGLGLIFYTIAFALCKSLVLASTIRADSQITRLYLMFLLLPASIVITTLGFNYFGVTRATRKKRNALLNKALEE